MRSRDKLRVVHGRAVSEMRVGTYNVLGLKGFTPPADHTRYGFGELGASTAILPP
jgi:hypothetical protein